MNLRQRGDTTKRVTLVCALFIDQKFSMLTSASTALCIIIHSYVIFKVIFRWFLGDFWVILGDFFHDATAVSGPGPPHCWGFTVTLIHTTLSKTPLDGWSARRRDLYPTTHNTHNRRTSMPPVGFEPAVLASERQQTHALNRAATGISMFGWRSNKTIYHINQ
jgi:hypothetical protein